MLRRIGLVTSQDLIWLTRFVLDALGGFGMYPLEANSNPSIAILSEAFCELGKLKVKQEASKFCLYQEGACGHT